MLGVPIIRIRFFLGPGVPLFRETTMSNVLLEDCSSLVFQDWPPLRPATRVSLLEVLCVP